MLTMEAKVAALVGELPDADKPGRESKFTGPEPADAKRIASAIIDGGRESLLALIGMIRDGVGGGEANYKPGYALRCVTLQVGAPGRAAQRQLLCETLASQLGGDKPSAEVQAFLVRELQLVGGPDAIATLGKLLRDAVLRDYAALALVAIGDGAASELRSALADVGAGGRLAIVAALGALADEEAIDALAEATTDKAGDVRTTAAWALARAAVPKAIKPLLTATQAAADWERIQLTSACLLLAENLLAAGRTKPASRVYKRLQRICAEPTEAHVRTAAERGLAACEA